MTDAAVRIDKTRKAKTVAARRELLDAAAVEAERIGREVDPDDRTGTQKHLLRAFINVLELRDEWYA